MRWRLEWWISRSVPSAMKARRGCREGSNSRGSAEFMTTVILSGGTPRAIESSRSGSWTVMSSSATAAEARATPVTRGMRGRSTGARKRSRKNSGMSSWRSSRSGTPPSFSGRAANVEEVRHRRDLHEVVSAPTMLAREAPGGHRGECHVLGEVTGEAGEEAVQREANDPLAPSVSSAASPGWRSAKMSTS